MYKVLTHYVMMETYEIPDKELKALEDTVKTVEDYSLEDKLLMLCDEQFRIKANSRDFEVVDVEHIV